MNYVRLVLLALVAIPVQLLGQVKPLPNAHAHNDYEHTRPLLDALDNGFTEVEADIFLIDGELYVAHTRPLKKDPAKTLRNLYLNPLLALVKANKGKVYPNYNGLFYLMIDFKTNGADTYRVLKSQLQAYQEMISQVKDSSDEPGKPVKVFISGNRPTLQDIQQDSIKMVALDGLPSNLGAGIPAALMPVISTDYGSILSWKGKGAVEPKELQELREMVKKAHAEGKKVRLWAAPDNPQVWAFLLQQGVDLINSDKLPELREFLVKRDRSMFDPACPLLQSGSFVQDKNFYWFTLIEKLPAIKSIFEQDAELASLLNNVKTRMVRDVATCPMDIDCMLRPFYFTQEEKEQVSARLKVMCQTQPDVQQWIAQYVRPSGMFIKYADQSDEALLSAIWMEACQGMEHMIDTYAKGKVGRYPNIDSVGFNVKSEDYKRMVRSVAYSVQDDAGTLSLFFQPMLQLALTLMDINNRDEAGRHEPMTQLDNKKAFELIPDIQWDNYKYATILVLGAGPDKENIALSAAGKLRIKVAAKNYHEGLAPFIIVSGGYVHPYQTPFAEAIEMKKALMDNYGVPERAIIIDPHARHTTTNFRNAARIMYRYGIPTDKMSLCTTGFDHIVYVTDPKYRFNERNMKELGYLPYQFFKQVSRYDIEFKPVITSLHADPLDPLDP